MGCAPDPDECNSQRELPSSHRLQVIAATKGLPQDSPKTGSCRQECLPFVFRSASASAQF